MGMMMNYQKFITLVVFLSLIIEIINGFQNHRHRNKCSCTGKNYTKSRSTGRRNDGIPEVDALMVIMESQQHHTSRPPALQNQTAMLQRGSSLCHGEDDESSSGDESTSGDETTSIDGSYCRPDLGEYEVQQVVVEVLSERLIMQDDQFDEITVKNNKLSADLKNVSSTLSEVELQLEEQQQQHEEQQQKNVESCQKVEVLSQRLIMQDDQFDEITVKNNELSADLTKVSSTLSEVELQLEEQQQQHEEQQQKNVESCQQVDLLPELLKANEHKHHGLAVQFEGLSGHQSHLSSRFAALEQQQQEQRERQEHQDVDYHQQVTQLETDLEDRDNRWRDVAVKNHNAMKAMYELFKWMEKLKEKEQVCRKNQQQVYPSQPNKGARVVKHVVPSGLDLKTSNNTWRSSKKTGITSCDQGARVVKYVIPSGLDLKTSNNAWRPSTKTGITSCDQDVCRQFRVLLNKMTPENFGRLINQMKRVNITKEEDLEDIVQLVLDKAIKESKFSEVYAHVCHHLAKIEVQGRDKPGKVLNFHTLLIESCKNELRMGNDANSSSDDDASKEKGRQRALGHVVFIGELFNAQVLDESFITNTGKGLLQDGNEQSLECFCRLIGIAGKVIDSTQAKMMDEYFTFLDKLMKERKMVPRIRFMLQDLVDLRMHNWIPRRKVERPNYLQTIREEARAEQR
uniref:eukaryotic translation initiation factor 4 gamma 1-like n=1 Tax=Myxine glutinosa TaxID=7769 RepID=UPI00358DDA42